MKRCVADWGGADDHSVHDAVLLRDLLRDFRNGRLLFLLPK